MNMYGACMHVRFYIQRGLYRHFDTLRPGPAALADGNGMFDSICVLLERNNIVDAYGEARDVPSLCGIAV